MESPDMLSGNSLLAIPDIENPYVLDEPTDRARLVAQSRMITPYIQLYAPEFIKTRVRRILDLGCGEGQLTEVLANLYPDAQVVGVDRDPQAVEAARRKYQDAPNISFETADAQAQLPPGPFDLIHASALLLHVAQPREVLRLAFESLAPGGYLWTKEIDCDRGTRGIHPLTDQLADLLATAMAAAGGNLYIHRDMERLLAEAHFTDIQHHDEPYAYGCATPEGRLSLSIALVGFHNAQPFIAKITGTPIAELDKLYLTTCKTMLADDGPNGILLFVNFVARRPE